MFAPSPCTGCDARLGRTARVNSYAILSYNTSDIVVYDDGRRIRMRDQESSRIRWQVARQSGTFVV